MWRWDADREELFVQIEKINKVIDKFMHMTTE